MRALIFEDDPSVRLVLTRVLERKGWTVTSFEHPGEFSCPAFKSGVCTAEHRCTDVILSDKNMPCVSGIEFFDALHRTGCTCKKIAMMSGFWTAEEIERVRNLGYKIFFKPFTSSELESWIKESDAPAIPNDGSPAPLP